MRSSYLQTSLAIVFLATGVAPLTAQETEKRPDRPKREDGPKGDEGKARPQFGGGRRGGPNRTPLQLVEKFDKDGDERLNNEERRAAREFVKKERAEGGGRGFGPPGGPRGRESDEPPKPGPHVSPEGVPAHPKAALFDTSVLRTFFLEFENADWEKELADYYRTDVDVPAKLMVDGKRFADIGVHFRGSSSYFTVGEGWKRSLNLAFDHTDPKQRLQGRKTLELLNAHADPTFLRTILYSGIARRSIPTPEAGYAKVVINGESWGIYVSQEQVNKDFLSRWFGTKGGIRWRIPANPRGGRALAYLGEDVEEYKRTYRLQTKGGEKGWPDLVKLCRTLNETPPDKLEEALSPLLDIDRALWFLALDNVLINDDGYWIRSSDFNLYQDPKGRFHVFPHDMNETFRRPGGPGFGGGDRISGFELDPFFGAEDTDRKPLISRLLAVPSLKMRYVAHVRTIAEASLDWKKLAPSIEELQRLISDEVKADTRKLDDYEGFVNGAQGDPEGESSGRFRRSPSLKSFVEERRKYLLDHPALKKPAPRIVGVDHEPFQDAPGQPIDPKSFGKVPFRITAQVEGDLKPDQVFLYYANGRTQPFLRVEMKAGGAVPATTFLATIPPLSDAVRVRYYVEARSTSEGTTSFFPPQAEQETRSYRLKDD